MESILNDNDKMPTLKPYFFFGKYKNKYKTITFIIDEHLIGGGSRVITIDRVHHNNGCGLFR